MLKGLSSSLAGGFADVEFRRQGARSPTRSFSPSRRDRRRCSWRRRMRRGRRAWCRWEGNWGRRLVVGMRVSSSALGEVGGGGGIWSWEFEMMWWLGLRWKLGARGLGWLPAWGSWCKIRKLDGHSITAYEWRR